MAAAEALSTTIRSTETVLLNTASPYSSRISPCTVSRWAPCVSPSVDIILLMLSVSVVVIVSEDIATPSSVKRMYLTFDPPPESE